MQARKVAIGVFTAVAVFAQTFEVASIRPAPEVTPETLRSGQVHLGTKIEGTRLDFGNVSLWDLLPYAFRVKPYRVVRPEWTRDSKWDILANLPAGTGKEQAPDMMQALLAERFKLTTHKEKREQQVYELTVAEGGVKVETSDPSTFQRWDGSFPGFNFRPPLGADETITGRILDQPNCGERWEFVPLPMAGFADALTMFLDKPVVDATGLKGDYKVALDINVETMTAMNENMARSMGLPSGPPRGGGGGRRGPDGGAPPAPPPGPPGQGLMQCMQAQGDSEGSTGMLFKAVQKLGLELKQRKAPVDTIVVDRLEKTPTEN